MLATGFPRARTESSAPQPRPGSCSPRSPGCPGGLPEALWEAPGWLSDGSNHAEGLLQLCLPQPGPPRRVTQRESLGPPCPAGAGESGPCSLSPRALGEAGCSAAVGRRRAVPSHWSQIISSCFVVWCLGPGASHLWGHAVARASQRNYPPPHRRRRRH